jgi:hypothetical protein
MDDYADVAKNRLVIIRVILARIKPRHSFVDVHFWHLADIPAAPAFVRYWTNNGQRATLGLNGSAANDPKQTWKLLGSGYSHSAPRSANVLDFRSVPMKGWVLSHQ